MDDLQFINGNPHEASQSLDCNFAFPSTNNGENCLETCDFTSDATLSYLKQMLLEEDIDDKVSTYQEEASLRATEKSFYDILGQNYPSSTYGYLLLDSENRKTYSGYHDHEKSSIGSTSLLVEKDLCCDVPTGKYSLGSDDPISTVPVESLLAGQIQKGAEEAMKFLPKMDKLCIDSDGCKFQQGNNENIFMSDNERGISHYLRSRKDPADDDMDLIERRNCKQIALSFDEPERNEISDKVVRLLGQRYIEEVTSMREIIQKELRDESCQNDAKSSKSVIERNMKQTIGGDVDLISLLIYCSEVISSNDHNMAMEIITKIKEHSSPKGNWSKRLAHYFVDGLEARLAGTGSDIYRRIITNQPSFSDMLKAYRLYLATCPYQRALFSCANHSIFNISKDASKVHIINYGAIHGFQWPSFFERFSNWKRTPPKIRMTIIEVPEPGFHPTKRVDSIGRRLGFYAKSFNVPFEYRGIASKWENVKPEDLNIRNDELVIVNCPRKCETISDEAVENGDSPRDSFLKTIRRIKPHVFIHGFPSGSYNSPFFANRFKSALFYFSSLFDMLDSIMPRDNPERLRIERDLFIPDAINAIACEGSERIVRPERYWQWEKRYLRAGFVQVPIDSMIIKNIKDFVREYYHKEFVIGDENGWLLMGWKGKILFALSAWKPDEV